MEQSAKRPRKVLIVITDGNDNASKLTLNNAIHRVQDLQGPIIYSDNGRLESRHARHGYFAKPPSLANSKVHRS